jgi:hypothetical protein
MINGDGMINGSAARTPVLQKYDYFLHFEG